MEIKYFVKSVYGIDQAYCADREQREAIQSISGQKTLTPATIRGLEQLGFSFRQVLPSEANVSLHK